MSVTDSPFFLLLTALVAGLLVPLSFAPLEWAWLAVPLMAVYVGLVYRANARHAFMRGWAFGTGMFLTGIYWVYFSLHDYGYIPVVFAALLTLILALFLGLFPALVAWLAARFGPACDGIRILLFLPALWVLMEWVRSWLFTGFPWLNLGVSQVETPLAGYAPITGELGMSWLVILTAAAIVYLFNRQSRRRLSVIAVIVLIWGSGFLLKSVSWSERAAPDFKVAMVQGNIDQYTKWNPQHLAQIIKRYVDLSRSHWDADVMIWPETAIPAFYSQVPDIVNELQTLAGEEETEMLIGIPYRDADTGEYFNSVMSLGSEVSFYHKRHLVPFGEFIPFQDWISDVLDLMGLPMSGFSRGAASEATLTTGNIKAGMSICYEIIFNSEVMQSLPEAHYLVNVSNNTWFGDSAMPFQQLQMARLRAIESQRYVLSATNNGVSAVINHLGDVIAQSPQFQQHVLRATVEPRTGVSPFIHYKNIPVLLLLFCILILARLLQPKSSL